jgi:hypothetical protein
LPPFAGPAVTVGAQGAHSEDCAAAAAVSGVASAAAGLADALQRL